MKTKRKAFKVIISSVAVVLGLFIVLIAVSAILYSPTYMYRVLANGDSKITDYKIFPERVIAKEGQTYTYQYALDDTLPDLQISYASDGKVKVQSLSDFIESTDTTSFIIIKDDKIIYEQYSNGYGRDSINTSFSMAKSIDSLLIGKAIEDGYIEDENQSIADYITEFKGTPLERITIRDLLLMRSDIAYKEGPLWFGDDAFTYWMPDLRRIALEYTELTDQYGGDFHYNNYHPLLLGLILERSTGMSVSAYFEKQIWGKIGAEYDASWSLDSEASGFEKMESGLNFRSIDFIKIGSMLLHNGQWNGQEIINSSWIETSTLADFPIDEEEYAQSFLAGQNIGYQYMWYSIPSKTAVPDYFAWGKYGQVLYISPSNDVVILRTGKTEGHVDVWPAVIHAIADKV